MAGNYPFLSATCEGDFDPASIFLDSSLLGDHTPQEAQDPTRQSTNGQGQLQPQQIFIPPNTTHFNVLEFPIIIGSNSPSPQSQQMVRHAGSHQCHAQEPSPQAAHVQAGYPQIQNGAMNEGVQMTPVISNGVPSRNRRLQESLSLREHAPAQAYQSDSTKRKPSNLEVKEDKRPRRPRQKKGEVRTEQDLEEDTLERREKNRVSANKCRWKKKEQERKLEVHVRELEIQSLNLENERLSLQAEFNRMYEHLQLYCQLIHEESPIQTHFRQYLHHRTQFYRDPITRRPLIVQTPPVAYQQGVGHELPGEQPAMIPGFAPIVEQPPSGFGYPPAGQQPQYVNGFAQALAQNPVDYTAHDPRMEGPKPPN